MVHCRNTASVWLTDPKKDNQIHDTQAYTALAKELFMVSDGGGGGCSAPAWNLQCVSTRPLSTNIVWVWMINHMQVHLP